MAEPSSLQNIMSGLQALTPGNKTINSTGYTDTQTTEDEGKTTHTTGGTTTSGRQDTTTQTIGGRTDTTTTSGRTDTSQLMLSDDDVNLLVQKTLESTQGLASITSGSHAAGLYGDTTQAQLSSNLVARAAAEAAAKRAKTVNTIGAQTSTTTVGPQTNTSVTNVGSQTTSQDTTSVTSPGKTTTSISHGAQSQDIKTSAAITADVLKKAAGLGLGASALQNLFNTGGNNLIGNAKKVYDYLFNDSVPGGATSISGIGDSIGLLPGSGVGESVGGAGLDLSDILGGVSTGGSGAVTGGGGLEAIGIGDSVGGAGLDMGDILGGGISSGGEGISDVGIVDGWSEGAGSVAGNIGAGLAYMSSLSLANSIGGKALGIKEISNVSDAVQDGIGDIVGGVGDAVGSVWKGVTGGCFITTAVCEIYKLPDDCEELQTLRAFRDTYMQEHESRKVLVEQYYREAPGIVAKFKQLRSDRQRAIAFVLMNDYIYPAIHFIRREQNEVALGIYTAMFSYISRRVLEAEKETDKEEYNVYA